MELTLQRGGIGIQSYLSCLGDLRETRLTATFAYLLARFPDHFIPLLGIRRHPSGTVSIEETEKGDRYDVLLEGFGRPIVIEAKRTLQSDLSQIERYGRRLRARYGRSPLMVVIDRLSTHRWDLTELRRLPKDSRFITWNQVAQLSERVAASALCRRVDPAAAAIAFHLSEHLKEHGMTEARRKEVYCRDVGSAYSVELYFRHGIYHCQSKYLNSANGCLYFAPYFSRRALSEVGSASFVPINEGISYISSIQTMRVVPQKGLFSYLREENVEEPRKAAELVGRGHHLVIILGPPRQLFLTPVTKKQLDFPGTLGSKVLTLERLLEASRLAR